MTHTPEINEEIVQRRAAGDTYTAIARDLSITKNAAIGRGHRAGAAQTPGRNRYGDPKPYVPKVWDVQEFPPSGHCLHSTDTAAPYRWCGLPTGSIEKPWCPGHAAIVFLPPDKKKGE